MLSDLPHPRSEAVIELLCSNLYEMLSACVVVSRYLNGHQLFQIYL